MNAILRRELNSYFATPVGFIFMGVFLSLSGLFFWIQNISNLSSDLPGLLSQLTILLMFLIPVLTMRLLCAENIQGSDKLIFTAPVTVSQIVFAKFLAAAIVLGITILLTNINTVVIAIYGKVYLGEFICAYLGFLLQGIALLALDLFITSFAKNMVSAAVLAFGINLLVWLLDILANVLGEGIISSVLVFLSLYKRFEPFVLGQFSPASTMYFILFTMCFLAAVIYRLDTKRLRG